MSTLLQTRDGVPSNKDARLTNVILEKNGDELNVIKRPGFVTSLTPATGIGGGATTITDSTGSQQLLSVVSDNLSISQSTVSQTWAATGGTTDFGSGYVVPTAILFFKNLFWILSPRATNNAQSGAIYSSPDAITWTQVSSNAGYNPGGSEGLRELFSAVVFGGKMWVMGGRGTTTATTRHDVWSSIDGVTWLQATSAAGWTARITPALLVFNKKMWVIGNTNGDANDVWSSPDGITWTQATASAAWSVRHDYRVFVLAGKMWVAGGYSGATFYNALYSSTDGATWTSVGNAAWSARSAFQCFVLNNIAYVATGYTSGGDSPLSGAGSTKDMYKSADGATWTLVTSDTTITGNGGGTLLNLIPSSSGSVVANNTVYIFGQVVNQAVSTTIYKATTATTSSSIGPLSADPVTVVPNPPSVTVPGAIVDWSSTLDGTQIAIKNRANAWNYTIAGQSLVQVTNSNYPQTTVRGLAYLDGTFYVMDTFGQIWGSAPNDFTTWTALNVINAQSEPDAGVCLTKYGQYVVAFGQYTTEFFFDAGNATGSPLSPVQNATQLVGCACADSVTAAESSVFWIAQSKAHGQAFNPQRFVARLEGMTYNVMSNPNVDRILNADTLAGAWGVYCKLLGHSFYIISLPVSAISLAYDMKAGTWYYFTTGTAQSAQSIGTGKMTYTLQVDGKALVNVNITSHGFADGDPVTITSATQTAYNGTWNIRYVDANNFTFVASTVPAATPATGSPTATGITQGVFPLLQAFNYNGLQLFQHYQDGHIYQISDTTYSDNGVLIDAKGRFERFDEGLSQDGNSQNKFNGWTDVVADRASSTILVRWSDNDYQTFSHYRPADLSFSRSRLSRCGAFLRRAYEIRHTDAIAMRFQGLDIGLEQGTE